ncbi:unnamed protein product [Chrysoparadoxa australica]
MVAMGPNVYVFGGLLSSSDPPGPTDQLWMMQMSPRTFDWHAVIKKVRHAPSHPMLLLHQHLPVWPLPWPCARWYHTALDIGGNRILLFGGFKSSQERLDDVWTYNTVGRVWEQQCLPASQYPSSPSPRGGHSSVLIGNRMIVFGGYGGPLFSRKDLNDLHCMDTRTYKWSKITPKGTPPGKRSGHCAVAADLQMFVIGGRSTATEYKDMFVLSMEVDPPHWSQVEHGSMALPRWNHCAYAIMSIPSWKIFVFGGVGGDITESNRQGTFMNDVALFDTGTRRWTYPEVEGEAPMPRSDAFMEYYQNGGKLVVHGGWANTWFNDTYILNVGGIVGPPYAIMDITPDNGAITGGIELDITGIDFVNTKDVVVRFSNKKQHIDVPGEFCSQTRITCQTPDFTGKARSVPSSHAVEVRLALGGDSFTTTKALFTFFPVTHCHSSLCYGPGLLSGGRSGKEAPFIIQARDADNNNRRQFGGDKFEVRVYYLTPLDDDRSDEEEVSEPKQFDGGNDNDRSPVALRKFEDCGDGTYLASYIPVAPGSYEVSVVFQGTYNGVAGPIRGSPVTVTFEKTAPPEHNMLGGPLVLRSLQEDIQTLLDFTTNTREGISSHWPHAAFNAALLLVQVAVKTNLHNYSESFAHMTFLRDRSSTVVARLKSNMVHVASQEMQLGHVLTALDELQQQVPEIELRIAPLLKAQTPKLKSDLLQLEQSLQSYYDQLTLGEYTLWATGPERSHEVLKESQVECQERVRTRQIKEMDHLAQMFDVNNEMASSRLLIANATELLEQFTDLWDVASACCETIEMSKGIQWKDLHCDGLEESSRGLLASTKNLPQEVRSSDAYTGLISHVKSYMASCNLMCSLKRSSLSARHWEELCSCTGAASTSFPVDDVEGSLRLGDLLALDLPAHQLEVETVTDKAAKEGRQESALAQLEETWDKVEFESTTYKDSVVTLLKMKEEDFEQLENDMLAIQSMAASRYSFFKKECLQWQSFLNMISDVMGLLTNILRMWSYLEPLFIHSEEVKKELPLDTKRFERIDKEVRAILAELWELPPTTQVKAACNKPGLLGALESIEVEQERCKKSLSEYLSSKRTIFPRFYFTSEADLLDILSNGNHPAKIIKHIDKLFLATRELVLQEVPKSVSDRPQASHFVAGVGKEVVAFEPAVALEGKVESYLQLVLKYQRITLGKALQRSMERFPNQARIDWLMNQTPPGSGNRTDPVQVSLLVSGIYWVMEVEQALRQLAAGDPRALTDYSASQVDQLNQQIDLTRSELSRDDRQRIMSMVTLDAHARDVVQMLIREGVTTANDFQWQSQLKQRCTADDGHSMDKALPQAKIDICDASFEYGFEFLGNGPRLVITPLTDRIYVTSTQALHLKMGCAPAGPAGTGKTETTKDLAAALGKCCYVFNCSPEMDYQSLGDIFKGLASSGSWGCFDEFNRLIPEVLSVCSLQFKAVTDGLKAMTGLDEEERLDFQITIEGQSIGLDASCGCFITMNPGYLGRSELPEGLKVLFRPITVMVPDLVLICENMLMAEGFVMARGLASKFYSLYNLLSQLLSKQDHYDWGLRAVKSVLVVAGMLKRAEPDLAEDALLLRALRDFNTPKIVKSDEVVFFGLLNDLFPSLNPERVVNKTLNDCVAEVCEDNGLWPDDNFKLKVCQLDELLAIRHCNFVMGPPGAGKSTCWKVLKEARCRMTPELKVKVVDLNPKTVPTEELYGHISLATREWKDGLLSSIMRDMGDIPNEAPKWIILDGDLDANWIESMNSVMDDNKMLTLASNERIPLKAHMRMIFEIRDLAFATPATVSRAGILFIPTEEGTQWRSLISSWVTGRSLSEEAKGWLADLFLKYTEKSVLFLEKEMKTAVPLEPTTSISALIRLLEGMIEGNRDIITSQSKLEHAFVFCAIWSFGAALTVGDDGVDYRKIFSDWWRHEFNKPIKLPLRDTVFDYYLSTTEGDCKFEPWKNNEVFHSVDFDSRVCEMSEVTVPTAETASVTYWVQKLVLERAPVMLVGHAGTGKTQLIMGVLRQLASGELSGRGDGYVDCTLNLNYYTSSAVLRQVMESSLQKKSGTNYGPVGSAKMVFFVDDLNLPAPDPYNTQSAVALIRQHLDYGHWYDPAKLALKTITNCQYVAAMNPTAGSFQVNPRLQRHFMAFAIGMPSPTSLLTIFETFLEGHLRSQGFEQAVVQVFPNLIKGALNIHQEVSENFRKTAKQFHYEFNIRHLTNVFQGLLKATPANFLYAEKLVYLWLHESERVYGDRLVSRDDIKRFRQILAVQAKKAFPQYNTARFFMVGEGGANPLIFSYNPQGEYEQVGSIDSLRKTLQLGLAEYNESHPVMDLVLFNEACLHAARICRILQQAGGHALLVGVGGSGKQSLSRLAVYLVDLSLYTIGLTKTYGIGDFKGDLQAMCQMAGIKGQNVAFLLNDTQIVDERMLVFLNDLLSSGYVPDLYTKEEQQTISESLAERVKAEGLSPDPPVCWEYFTKQVKNKLHVILCFSPMGPSFQSRARKFPALVSCTVIDWFQPWPNEALASVGRKCLQGNPFLEDPALRKGVESFLIKSFETVTQCCQAFLASEGREVFVTPKSFLELIKLFTTLLQKKNTDMDTAISRLAGGVVKLQESGEAVAVLEKDLKIMLLSAEEKREQADKMAAKVLAEKEGVEVETERANGEAAKVAIIQADVSQQQADAEKDLEKAEPAVIAAMSALDTLDKKELGQCKTMNVPPTGVGDIFIAVMVLMANVSPGVPVSKQSGKVRDKDRNWDSVKKSLLNNINGFLEELKGFKSAVDEGRVPAINMREVRPFLDLEHFSVEVIEKRNSAAAGLCSWVLNIVNYYDIVASVEPKRKALRDANEQLSVANSELSEVRERLSKLQAQLDELTLEFNKAEAEKKEAQDIYEKGRNKLDLAQRLVRSLGGESKRWSQGVASLTEERQYVVGNVLLASAFMSYVGPFTKPFREQLVHDSWIPVLETVMDGEPLPMSPDVSQGPLKVLASDAEIALWNTQGLPQDLVSAENGAIVCNCVRWPLLIDPQLQGLAWLKNKESHPDPHPLPLTWDAQDLLHHLQQAMENGWSMIIENIGESIDPVIMPVVTRVVTRRGRVNTIKLGNEEVDLHPSFRFFLHTKLLNPSYPPEVQADTTLINFMVTPAGLGEQLLSVVIRKERPDLASHKSALLQQQNEFRVRIRGLEDDILARLAESSGDITDDRALIEGLEESKELSVEIEMKLQEMTVATEKIINLSEQYREVASRGSLLFFTLNDLHKINSLYMYSLNAFVVIFQSGIDQVNAAFLQQQQEEEERSVATTSAAALEEGSISSVTSTEGGSRWKKLRDQKRKQSVVDKFGWNEDLASGATRASAADLRRSAAAMPEFIKEQRTISPEEERKAGLDLQGKILNLKNTITQVVFNYVRRGLLEKDKLSVASVLALRILQNEGSTDRNLIHALTGSKVADMTAPFPDEVKNLFPEHTWRCLVGLDALAESDPAFSEIGEQVINFADEWRDWYAEKAPEDKPMPGEFSHLAELQRLIILRVLRPDRFTAAMRQFVSSQLGTSFVSQPPFNMGEIYEESSCSTPVMFLLFPGVDPTTWVEAMGKQVGITAENGLFVNISMGQGQEAKAAKTVQNLAEKGGWVFLQNLHLMQSWLPTLDTMLENISSEAVEDFRCFISAEPPPLPTMKNMPEALLQSCVKVANEASADLRSNFVRAWAAFDQDKLDSCAAPKEFKSCLFGLCFFHSLILGRRSFGQQGWSRPYGFSMGDLTICANILSTYLETAAAEKTGVPWADLRYIFGEIMYGGHITDFWDRRTNSTYLKLIFDDDLLKRKQLAPGFASPEPEGMDHTLYGNYIDRHLPPESPDMFGLPPNAEVGYLTSAADEMCNAFLRLESSGLRNTLAAGDEDADAELAHAPLELGYSTPEQINAELLPAIPASFDMHAIGAAAKELLDSDSGPYVVVVVQECARMNTLLVEVNRSLVELVKGMQGKLNMTQAMESLQESLSTNQVPGRDLRDSCSWEKYAWPSRKSLSSWLNDLIERCSLLRGWVADLKLPASLWLPGLFNPTAFLTAVKQVHARRLSLPLDQMTIETHVTSLVTPAEAKALGGAPEQGALIHGLYLEGGRWQRREDLEEEDEDELDDLTTRMKAVSDRKAAGDGVDDCIKSTGHLSGTFSKELQTPVPIIYAKAVPVQECWKPEAVGFMRPEPQIYNCPVYTTATRGPHFVFLSQLRTLLPEHHWTISGCAMVMQTDL